MALTPLQKQILKQGSNEAVICIGNFFQKYFTFIYNISMANLNNIIVFASHM
jgi:hypothetical protein